MKKIDSKLIKYPIVLFSVVVISTFLLAVVYNFTKPIIENNALRRENEIVLSIFPNATISSVSTPLSNEEKELGLVSVVKADNNYVYKATVKGLYAGEETTFLVVIDSEGNFTHFSVVSTQDTDYISKIEASQFTSRFINKNYQTDFNGNDMQIRATKTATPIANAIKAAGDHYGREIASE